ncbi:MAG: ATP-grasp domain-containing protein [Bacteroidetes bacterium]|nr:ATP-grasp domain-containing protein [Bacteroidota bacterium]
MASKRAILVFTGGYSGEAVISRKSAQMVMDHIDRERFDPTLVHIEPSGWYIDANGTKTPTSLELLLASHAFIGAFIMVHGTPGEDGILQAELQAAGVKCTTGDEQAMALTFHKGHTSNHLRNRGIRVARSIQLLPGDTWDNEAITEDLGLPCFVKPNETGSSIGIHKVNRIADLDTAIQDAMQIGGKTGVIIEAMLRGREFTSGVIPDEQGNPLALPITEIKTHREFFDYAAKYNGESDEITPAEISDELRDRLQAVAVSVYRATNMRGMARVDMMAEEDGEPHVIEINTVPGFSEASIIPKQAAAVGISKQELISQIIDHTLL